VGLYTDAAYLTESKFTSRFPHLEELVLRYTTPYGYGIEGLQFSDLLSNLTKHQNIRKITLVLQPMDPIWESKISFEQEVAGACLEMCRKIDDHLCNRDAFPRLDSFAAFLYYEYAGSEEKPSLEGTMTSWFPKLAKSGRFHVLR
jgi:hypothetical protein